MDKLIKNTFITLLILKSLDILTTAWAFKLTNSIEIEVNPLSSFLMKTIGIIPTFSLSIIFIILIIYLLKIIQTKNTEYAIWTSGILMGLHLTLVYMNILTLNQILKIV